MPEEGTRGEFVDPQVQTLLERMRESAALRGAIGSAPPDVMRQRFNEADPVRGLPAGARTPVSRSARRLCCRRPMGAGSAAMTFFWNSYLGEPGPVTDARADLLLADKTGLPRIDLVSAGLDPLTDDILTLIEQLNEAGCALSHRHYEGVIHGFFSMSLILDTGHLAVMEAAAALKSALFGGDRST